MPRGNSPSSSEATVQSRFPVRVRLFSPFHVVFPRAGRGRRAGFRPALALLVAPLAGILCAAAPSYELSDLPACPGDAQMHGVIRIHANELVQHLVHLWEDGFRKSHPLVRFSDYFVPNGINGLVAGTADVALMGHAAWRSDRKAFEGVYGYDMLEIMFATGGFDHGKGNTPAPIFFVNKDNPLSGLTLRQLDGIFGEQRTGGWNGVTWTTACARGPGVDIRTWGELGLTGAWERQPIRLYGFDATLSGWSGLIQQVVFHGGDKWNPALNEMVRGGSEIPADRQIVEAVAHDRYAIGFNFMRQIRQNPDVKPLAIAAQAGGPYIAASAETIYRRTYPLANAVFIYLNRPPGRPLSPRLKEFLTYILDRQGQRDVVEDGMYIPLTPAAALEQRSKLD